MTPEGSPGIPYDCEGRKPTAPVKGKDDKARKTDDDRRKRKVPVYERTTKREKPMTTEENRQPRYRKGRQSA